MPSKAEEILLDKYDWDTLHQNYSGAVFKKEVVLIIMKDIAEGAFQAGVVYGEVPKGMGGANILGAPNKTQYLNQLFNED